MYGFDGNKQVKGRKRQLVVDSLGLIMKVIVAEAHGGERILAAAALMELLEENPEIVEKIGVKTRYAQNLSRCKVL